MIAEVVRMRYNGTCHDDIDLTGIWRKRGGGGHQKAAVFLWKEILSAGLWT